jgi:hypothetical protein
LIQGITRRIKENIITISHNLSLFIFFPFH